MDNKVSQSFEMHSVEGESHALTLAKMHLDPAFNAVFTGYHYMSTGNDLKMEDLYQALEEQTKAVHGGDLKIAERMLVAQAHTLDLMFNRLAKSAINTQKTDLMDKCMKLALRAQTQSRATWETLAQIKNPPIAGYVKQANFSAGHQQVNNFCSDAPARTRENKNEPNELLEVEHGERLDSRATGQTSAVNPAMAAVD